MALRVIIVIITVLVVLAALTAAAWEIQQKMSEANNTDTSQEDTDLYSAQLTEEEISQLLLYCNDSDTLADDYTVETEEFDEVDVNYLMVSDLTQMTEDAAADGIDIEILLGYMTYDECEAAYQNAITQYQNSGYTVAESETLARDTYPQGGSNEFQTGMLIKVSDLSSEEFAATDVYNWLAKNGINYGFIVRYTEEKESVTGRSEDLTVFRYVGAENAVKMRSFNMCLEEYAEYCSYQTE